jgi:GDP-4-dehydro-6-deoxy-D-mannose reductase
MTSLVIGAQGFIGSHLVDFLLARGDHVVAAGRSSPPVREGVLNRRLDILDAQSVQSLLAECQPDEVYHLAAQSFPTVSWEDPKATFRVNVDGTLNVLDALRDTQKPARMVFASSSSIYAQHPEEQPIREDGPLLPSSPYGVSKLAAEQLVRLYALRDGLPAVIVRPFFLIGPRKIGDVCSDWARSIAEVERGMRAELSVGNLDVVRDFLPVEDGVRGLALAAERGRSGESYNISSGRGVNLREVLGLFAASAGCAVPVRIDPNLLRPVDERVKIGDNSRLRALGWTPSDGVGDAIKRTLEYWRRIVS